MEEETQQTRSKRIFVNDVDEYSSRNIAQPVKICLLGPPAVGKSTVAKKLCQHYKIHHISIKEMIEEKISQLNEMMSETDSEYVSEEAKAAAQDQLEKMNTSMDMNQGRLAEHEVVDILREKLNSKSCRNQGFVLEDFPKTYKQARTCFSEDTDTEEQSLDLMFERSEYNKTITPEHVFVLDASDDFLIKRIQGLPESVAEKMGYTQDEFMARLNKYRHLKAGTMLDFFDHQEIYTEHIEVSADDPEYTDVLKKITEVVGPTPEEQEEENRKREEENGKREDERRQKLAAEAVERKRRQEDELAESAAQYDEWKNLQVVKQEECELQEAQSYDLRSYLMKYVMSDLSEAMAECCKIKPEDPVDFLAEYILRTNQEEE
ncbi:adenylate kinase 7-like isoform X3 [Cololabis saira]|uniref:adenylate kinase 7-like isoform X3 n=1 Tax=Cololabis saira TaxID=129043 RepID=UPI002AD1DB68|nr:adenylate kinase 7-like isoform X3 [Cololabis saira]